MSGDRGLVRLWPGEAEVDGGLVEEAVDWINGATRRAGLEVALAVGRYVEESLFLGAGASGGGGRPAGQARAVERRREHRTYRALAEHPRLEMGASTLWSCVQLVGQMELLGEELGRRLSWSAHRELMGVRDRRARRRLAERASEAAWGRERLRAEVGKVRAKQRGARTGRPPTPSWRKGMARVRKGLELARAGGEVIEVEAAELERLGVGKVQETLAEVRAQIEALRGLEAALEAGLGDLESTSGD